MQVSYNRFKYVASLALISNLMEKASQDILGASKLLQYIYVLRHLLQLTYRNKLMETPIT